MTACDQTAEDEKRCSEHALQQLTMRLDNNTIVRHAPTRHHIQPAVTKDACNKHTVNPAAEMLSKPYEGS